MITTIRFGPAGTPLSCKGHTLKDGIEDVHNLSLSAMEVQMVRASTAIMYPSDEHYGMAIKDVDDYIVLEVNRDGDIISNPETIVEEGDELVVLPVGNIGTYANLFKLGKMAKRLDVELSLHAPYYMDLGSEDDIAMRCFDSIRHAGLLTNALNGEYVVTSLGIYDNKLDAETIENNIYESVDALTKWWKSEKLTPKIAIEITGRQQAFGSLDQVLDICDSFKKYLVPAVNFAHHHSRESGSLIEIADYNAVLDQVLDYNGGKMYALFSGVEHRDGNELRYTPIKKGDLKFELLGDILAEIRPEATVISASPLLEHDAMYMRIIYERMINKRIAKMLRQRKKELEQKLAEEEESLEDE